MNKFYPSARYSATTASRHSPGFFPRFFLLCAGQLLFLTAAFAQTNPQQYRWTGASIANNNWDTPNNWQVEDLPNNPGAWIAAAAPPGSDDDVSFDAAHLAPGGRTTVFVSVGGPNLCDDMDWTGAVGMTFTGDGNAELQVFGGITLVGVSNLTFTFPGTIRLRDQTGGPNIVTITSAAQRFTCNMFFDGAREWHLVGPDPFWVSGDVKHYHGKIIAQTPIVLDNSWVGYGNIGGSLADMTFLPGPSVTVNNSKTLDFAYVTANFSAANTDFIFTNGGWLAGDPGKHVHNVIFQGTATGTASGMEIDGKVEFFSKGTLLSGSPFINEAVFHQNGVFQYSYFFNQLKLAVGKIYEFHGTQIYQILPGGSITQIDGTPGCDATTTLQTYGGGALFRSCGDLHLDWVTVKDITYDYNSGYCNPVPPMTPVATLTNSINLGNSPGWAITGPAGQQVFWQGDVDDDWFTPGNWSTGCVPNAYDDVYFDKDVADPAGLGGTQCVITGQQYAYCRSMIWQDWPGGVPPTVLGNFSMAPQTLFVYGHLIFQEPGCNDFQGEVVFRKDLTPTNPIVQKSITSVGNHFHKSVYLTGHDDTYTLTDDSFFDLILGHNDGNLVNLPNLTATISIFQGYGQSFDFHNSTLKITNPGTFSIFSYPGTINSSESLVWFPFEGHLTGGNNIFHNVLFEGYGDFHNAGTDNTGTVTFEGNGDLYAGTFTYIHKAQFLANGRIRNFYGFDQLEFAPGQYYDLGDAAHIEINDTPTSHFNAGGADCSHYTYLMGTGPTPATITNLDPDFNLHFDNVTMQKVQHGGGSGTYTATGVQMENVTWDFTNPQTARHLHWVGNQPLTANGWNWENSANWDLTPTGTGGECPPDWNDDVEMGTNPILSGNTIQLAVNGMYAHTIDWTPCSNLSAPCLVGGSSDFNIWGSLKYAPASKMNLNHFGLTRFNSNINIPNEEILSANQIIGPVFEGSGTWKLLDDSNFGTVFHRHGTLKADGHLVKSFSIYYGFGYSDCYLDISNSVMEFTSGNYAYGASFDQPAGNLNALGSEILLRGGGFVHGYGRHTLNDIHFMPTLFNNTIPGFVDGVVSAHTIIFDPTIDGTLTNIGSVTDKVIFNENGVIEGADQFNTTITPNPTPASALDPFASIDISPAPVNFINEAEFKKNGEIRSNTAFNKLTLWGGNEYTITAGKTVDILPFGEFEILQLSGFAPATVRSSDPVQNPQLANFAHIYSNGGNLCADYLYLDNINRDGSASSINFHDFPNFNNINQSNYGWDFTMPCPECPPATQTAPALNAALSVTKVLAGSPVTLVLANLPAGYEAVWFNETQTAELYHDAANQFQTTDYDPNDASIVFHGAIREIATGCISPTLSVTICVLADVPTFSGNTALCPGESTALSIASGNLYGATGWVWYATTCSGTPIGTGTGITVTPAATTTYYAVGEGGCAMDMGVCGQVTVTVNDPPVLNCPADQTVCAAALPLDLGALGAAPAGGVFSGAGVSGSSYSDVAGTTNTVTYTYTDGNGCTNTCTFAITVSAVTAAISGDLSICPGETTVLTATGGSMYSWNTGAMTEVLTVEEGDTYTVTVTGAGGCTDVAMATVDQWLPPAIAVTYDDPYCYNGDLTMTETGGEATDWSWSGPYGFTSTLQSPVIHNATEIWASNNYYLTITDMNGCTNSTTFIVQDLYPQTSITNTVSNQALCTGAMTAAVNFTASHAGSTFSWTNNQPSIGLAASGTGNIAAFTAANTTNAPVVATITATPVYFGCPGIPKSFTITVYPLPAVSCPAAFTVYTNSPAFALTGASPAGGTYSGPGVSGGQFNPAAAGLGAKTITYTYTDAHNCTGSCTFTITVASCLVNFSGHIWFSNNPVLGVKDAAVALTGSATGSNVSDIGGYFFIGTGVCTGNFALTPTKSINKLNGVTAADVTAIHQHVAFSPPITDPYKVAAADVNGSNSITTLDASTINLALLGSAKALSIMKSWRFVPTSHVMTNPPWGYPEQRTYTNVSGAQTNQDFYGIKMGDVVPVYANPANFGAGEPLVLRAPDRVLHAGETFVVDFSADQLNDLAAFQLALVFDPARLQFITADPLPGLPLGANNFGVENAANGEIRVVWSQAAGFDVAEATPAFRLHFKALESGARLSELLQPDDETLPALTYNSALLESPLWLWFGESTGTVNPSAANGVQLFQNRPNPFAGTTVVGFLLPEACDAQLRVFGASGQMLAERRAWCPAGKNEAVFDLGDAEGVLYYELTTPFGVLSRKMVAVGKR